MSVHTQEPPLYPPPPNQPRRGAMAAPFLGGLASVAVVGL
jgi:hypothetical protein